jgi:zinc D-Ala-D-Ala carboxypeptidase
VSLRYFSIGEFSCRCCGENKMDDKFLLELDELRHRFRKPLAISSGYRCPIHNARVSSTGATGPHTTGHAADIAISRGDALALLRLALTMRFTGIGINQKGGARFLHLDDLPNSAGCPRPIIWSYP